MLITHTVAAFIEREQLLSPAQKLVVGVSGGPDSLCLLDCLDRLEYPLLVAHLDHRLRPGSWREAEFVLREARRRGLPAIVERVRPPGLRQSGGSLEEAARLARYAFLVGAAQEWGASVVAVGHTADDQVETILMHFLRGAGIYGLRGMLPRTPAQTWAGPGGADGVARSTPQGVEVIRPLLETTRSETEAHCRAAGLRPRRDPTNQDQTFYRNRLRHQLLPLLEGYNPGIREVLARTGQVMRREAAMLDQMLDAAEPGVMSRGPGDAVRFSRATFRQLPEPIQAGLLWRAVSALAPGQRDFGYQAIELARARIEERMKGRRTTLPGGVEMLDQGDFVLLLMEGSEPAYPDYPQLGAPEGLRLDLGGRIALQDGGSLSADGPREPPPFDPGARLPGLIAEAWLDAASLSPHLLVRPAKPGERMRPLGMQGHRKLADIFNSFHIPASARRRWPVVLSGDTVVWLTGLRIAHEARMTEATRRAVRLRFEIPEGIPLGIPEGTQA
jgi:tRNA(Ile)-lysidine synthase